MHFGLTEEQLLLQETVRGFAAGECPAPRLREIFDAGTGHDPALWKGLAEMGIAGLTVPEPLGGAGLGLLELALVMEELGVAALPGPSFGHALACLAIQLAGSDAQRQRWLPDLASGERIATVAFAEPGGAWDPESWSLAAEGDHISGAKRHVPHASLADLVVVGLRGGRFAVVERGARGLRIEDERGVDRTRPIAALAFDRAPAELLGGDFTAAARVRDAALVMLAADAFGAAWHLTRMTVEYAKTRQQFGTPIAQFQAVKHQLADMATQVEPTRGLFWYAAHAWDALPDEAPRAAAIAKAHITARASEVARAAVELHGGLGFTWECDVQLWFKRAMFDRVWCGGPEHHRARIAALGDW
ncbi:MAG: acyl-CoA dehydrogenase [Deltaproteobacteria bacterium]|nr:MAG: acyl-CoA dehydrogenase [Deltaproteobacteria bacterium]